jgi:acyl-[acyl-carrier-protein]-phospholipid O-acyltransferase / long-chain-fatty-acid--[acyl-carrier-protein] ligase
VIPFLARCFFRLFFGVRVYGAPPRKLPEKLLIVSNHQSFLDGPLLGAFLGFEPTYLVNTIIAGQPLFKLLLHYIHYLTIDPANPMAIKRIAHLVDQGQPAMIFPEGRITVTGTLMKIYDGPAFVAAKTGAAILPVRIEGLAESVFSRMGPGYRLRLFPRITLTFLPLEKVEMPVARRARDRRRMASEQLRRIMEKALATAPPQTLFESFLGGMKRQGRGAQLCEDIRQKPETFGQMLKASLALGRIVAKLTKLDERVGVLLPNLTTTAALLEGMFARRRVPAMLNYTAGLEGLRSACRTAEIKTVITSRAFLEKAGLTQTVERLGGAGIRIVYLEELKPLFGLGDKLWLMGYALWFPRRTMEQVKPEDPAMVLFTSGSEGRPKGVVLSHAAMLANVSQVRASLNIGPRDHFMNALPLFHSFGILALVAPFSMGSRVFFYPSPLHYRMIPEVCYDRDCTVIVGTSTFLGNYAKFAHPWDFYSMRYVVSGAEKLNEEVRRVWVEKFGIRIIEGYGATECSPVISANRSMAWKAGTVGCLMPRMEAQVVPVEGIEGGGSLHVRGPNVMLGYLKHDRPGELQPPESELGPGWYDTGDIVEIDSEGFITLKGRMKRFAKVAGEMISLELVERIAALASPGAGHAASSTHGQATRGELLVLFTEDAGLRREQLQAAARNAGLPEIAVPRRIEFLRVLPLLGNGKRDYVTLKAMADDPGLAESYRANAVEASPR